MNIWWFHDQSSLQHHIILVPPESWDRKQCCTCGWWRAAPAAAPPLQTLWAAAGTALCGNLDERYHSLELQATGTWGRQNWTTPQTPEDLWTSGGKNNLDSSVYILLL